MPKLTLPPALADAEGAVERAEKEARRTERSSQEAATEARLAAERLASAERELRELGGRLEGAPAPSELERAKRLDEELAEARRGARTRRETETRAAASVEKLEVKEKSAWKAFDAARDRVASLEPPPVERTSLATAWTALRDWASERAAALRDDAARARELAEAATGARRERFERLRSSCRELDVPAEGERLRDAVVSRLAAAEAALARIEEAITRSEELKTSVEAEREAAQVAGALGQHLKATGFERWLLEEAFRRLAEGATAILHDLSSGQYSFEYDDKLNFEVVDHRNADERRSARTLSGGETFLASLALALTLAEQTAELAAEGSAKLESLFLDEGFGTLDDDTLEVVAAAIEELGAKGRIVGLVTHQQSLAEKIPVQFRVSKGPVTATVERVVA
jgi:exonuclease SbcC